MGDAIPVAADRLETVIEAQRRVAVMLKLLEHRVWQAGDKGVAAQHQDRQTVGMGQCSSGHEIGRARTCRCGAEHETLAQMVFGVGGRGKAHRLLVLAAIERQGVLNVVERLTQAGHIAMAKDAETTTAKTDTATINLDELGIEVAHDGLRHRQFNRAGCAAKLGHAAFPPVVSSFWRDRRRRKLHH
jgi:hypothetical protein